MSAEYRRELSPAKKFNLLIHPFFAVYPGDCNRDVHYQMWAEINRSFIPHEDEVLGFMPNLPNDFATWRNDIAEYRWDASYMGIPEHNWIDAYKSLRKGRKDNVLLLPNLINSQIENEYAQDLVSFQHSLAQKGFCLDENTEIEIGGEWLDCCVLIIARKVMILPQVHNLRINMNAVTMNNHEDSWLDKRFKELSQARIAYQLDKESGYLILTKMRELGS